MLPFSNLNNSSSSSSMLIVIEPLSQSWAQTRAWTMNGVSEVLNSFRMRPLVLNADSEATVDTRTANTSWAILANIGNLAALSYHHFRMLKSSLFTSFSSCRYFSYSDLLMLASPSPPTLNFLFIRDTNFLPSLF